MKKISLLIIEDEPAIRDLLRFSLPSDQYTLMDAETVAQGTRLLADVIPDLIILDWMLPDKSGIDFIKWIKRKENLKDIPIVMLTAKAEEDQKVQGLMSGADDYVTKPFSTAELNARIKAILRRGLLAAPNNELSVGQLILNTSTHQVSFGTEMIKLMPLEYKLLHFFFKHPNKVYNRDQLINFIWGGNVYIDERTVDVQIKRLRSKLKKFDLHNLIKTIRGMGYIFDTIKLSNEKKA
ncbi:MAG: response regulator [Proteobacteria bacterium]|nr:response regulator [Pseudomonadota bacterium]